MSYAQVKIYLTETEIDDAILRSARNHMIPMESGQELYVMDWDKTNLDNFGVEATLAFRQKEEINLPSIPKVSIREL